MENNATSGRYGGRKMCFGRFSCLNVPPGSLHSPQNGCRALCKGKESSYLNSSMRYLWSVHFSVWGKGGDGVRSLSCKWWVAGLNHCALCLSCCVLGLDTSPAPPTGGGQRDQQHWPALFLSNYNVAHYHQGVNDNVVQRAFKSSGLDKALYKYILVHV